MIKPWWVLSGVALAVLLVYISYTWMPWPQVAPALPASLPQLLEQGDPDRAPTVHRVRAAASVVPVRSAEIGFSIEGGVQKVLVEEGELVVAGQLLVKLKDDRQRVQVAQAQAALNRARAALALLEAGARPAEIAQWEAALDAAAANYARLVEGVLPGAIAVAEAAVVQAQAEYRVGTAEADPLAVVEATAELELARVQLESARAAYNQVRGDPNIGMRSEAMDLQEATAAYNAAQATLQLLEQGASPEAAAALAAAVKVAQAELDALRRAEPGEVAGAEALVREAQAVLEGVQSGSRAEEIAVAQGDVDVAVALMQEALVALAETELRAPFDGTVTGLAIERGETVSPGTPVLQMADLSNWQIETLGLTELDVANIEIGAAVDITFDALPGLALPGRVQSIRPVGAPSQVALADGLFSQQDLSIDEQLNGDIVYRVRIEPEGHDGRLLWRMSALVDFGER
jgi:HlyD family secretion protein